MAPATNDGFDPDLLRRLREFQAKLRTLRTPRKVDAVVPARAALSAAESDILLVRLRKLSPALADSLEQALTDLNDHTRRSFVGPAGEVREVMRAAVQLLAPDDQVRKQPWFVGTKQGEKINPSQAERTRYAVQQRGGTPEQVKDLDSLVDELVGQISRRTYSAGSRAFHAGTQQQEVRKLTRWVFAVLDEVLR
jgi:Predicted pPIWI-associating nuclease